ncbi:5-oxoprolinase subunit PxpA [Paludisphaera rhizosphaerae]|uniref:5-oxoprolinase subunit PxpA n=1 Tax=Paludisphaera rhizosphaerae TaxID=2711216 RepID=UPI0013EE376E|nr:5-oxoprolinase subunit PxpA [Paludisphaera rhizosphaerae]
MNLSDSIDVNADLGEGFPNDEALLERVSSASLSCGAHAGDPAAIRRTLAAARTRGVVVGAHPGYPDREGFGRRDMDLDAETVNLLVANQALFLKELADAEGVPIRFLKPHGALYNQAQRGEATARGVVAAAVSLGLPLLGQPGTRLESLAKAAGVEYIPEGFPDRRYLPDGSLTPRTQPDAVIHDPDELAANVRALLEGGRVRTLCLHGDHPDAVAHADRLRAILDGLGIAVRPFAGDSP